MEFRVEQDHAPRGKSGPYKYRIYKGARLVARYWHDFRGDEHGIDFLNGHNESCPVGRVIEFLEGGGPQAPRLSERAVAYLKAKIP
jgi:hypothetical protein